MLLTKKIKIIALFGIFILTAFGCEKEELLPPNQAKGRIIQIFTRCYGECIMIEVENPKGIGMGGTFAIPGNEESRIYYENAIGVPYFSKTSTEIPTEFEKVPITIGTWLYFEYRDITEDEKDLFYMFPPPVCTANIVPPPAKPYIIIRVIEIK
jgi:hypothetical protein